MKLLSNYADVLGKFHVVCIISITSSVVLICNETCSFVLETLSVVIAYQYYNLYAASVHLDMSPCHLSNQ